MWEEAGVPEGELHYISLVYKWYLHYKNWDGLLLGLGIVKVLEEKTSILWLLSDGVTIHPLHLTVKVSLRC